MQTGDTPTRRRVLGAVGGAAAAATGGCLQRVRSRLTRRGDEPVSVTIKTVPVDEDARAVRVARHLSENLRSAGVETNLVPLAEAELRRDVLLDHEFDVYVGSYPTPPDPDFLYPLLHSRYASDAGWQNPFGYADLQVDDLLAAQRRRAGDDRRSALADLQDHVVAGQPFSVVAFPDALYAVDRDLVGTWTPVGSGSSLGLLDDDPGDAPSELRLATTDARPTMNLNPLSVEFRDRGEITGLLYDSLARHGDGGLEPWLAAEWTWESGSPPTATVSLRPDLQWHDGEPLTAGDVAFTYEFLADTALGGTEHPVPAPRFQGQVSLVDEVTPVDARTARFRFVESDPAVAKRAFSVPVLPRHVWIDRADRDVVAGVELPDGLPHALGHPNVPAVGSGPLRFERAESGERLVLARDDDHFLHRDGGDAPAERVPFERVTFTVVPSDDAAVAVAASGEVDAVASSLDPDAIAAVERAQPLELVVGRSRSFYHVGFNARRAPFSNPRFRRTVARLLDREHLVADAFDGSASAAVNPLAGSRWEASLDSSLSFPGSDGSVDEQAARAAFRDAGFRYDEADRLLMG